MLAVRLRNFLNKGLLSRQLPFITFKGTSFSTSEVPKETNKNLISWEPVYKFRYIQAFSSINRSKIYQTGFTAIAIPISFGLTDYVDPLVVGAVGISGIITLSITSYFMKNTVGFIYTAANQPEKVKLAYLDFWGNRKDVITNIEDVMPLSQIPKSFLDFAFLNLQFNSEQPRMKLFHKVGVILDPYEFSKIFGEF